MKGLFILISFLSLSTTVFAKDTDCELIHQVLVASISELDSAFLIAKVSASSREANDANSSLDFMIDQTQRTVALARSHKCLSETKSKDTDIYNRYMKIRQLSSQLESSNNPLIQRSIPVRAEASYINEIYR